ncbi:hypothetical protein N7452_010557 [Penicillium brevicompactum]|uniref:Uncharacterized protein n=1 Tax=Penicillium brevicompactum TaxID=5074 RepID=A0A9W9UB60_PENBR|nr:hypothetical protein N7452_010557 [Penicillium brevicompactum]
MGFPVCDKLMALLLADGQINALREFLPRLPSSLAFVLSAFESASSSVVTLMPTMPPVLDSLLKPDIDMATTFRLFLRDSIPLTRLNALKQQHPPITELLSELYDIETYAACFTTLNALSFTDGLNRFQDAAFQLERSQLKLTYLKFLQHFRNIARARHE